MCIASYPWIVFTAPFNGSEPLARDHSLLDEAVVLLDDVVQIGRRSASAGLRQFARLLQFRNDGGIRWVSVDVNDPWPTMSDTPQSKLQEVLGRDSVPVRRQQKIDGVAFRIQRALYR
jgi:hypothetical protein